MCLTYFESAVGYWAASHLMHLMFFRAWPSRASPGVGRSSIWHLRRTCYGILVAYEGTLDGVISEFGLLPNELRALPLSF